MSYRKTTEEELSLVLEKGEGYSIEFKRSVNSDLPKEMVALANASGGRIFIGVDDDNSIIGCTITNELTSRIETMATNCDPYVTVFIEILWKHNILVIHIPEGGNKPHRCTKGFFLRNGSNSQKLNTQDITDFIQAEGKIRFDHHLRLDLNWIDILDKKRLKHFLKLAKISMKNDLKNLLLNLGAGDYKNENFYLNQTGVLFFSKNPLNKLFHASVICVLFKGISKAYILDRKELTGNLLENIEDALIFIKKHLKLRWQINSDSTQRKEELELPEIALREAVINAVCHRDYIEQGANVMIEIFDDRVEIHNPGGLPKGLSKKDFGKRSMCRNSSIANLLLRCNYIEKMGSGIERIYMALADANCPEVIISFEKMFSLKFIRTQYKKAKKPPYDTPYVAPHVTPQVVNLLETINGEMTRKEIMDALNLKDTKNFQKTYLNKALEAELIEMAIPQKPKSRRQTYRVTEAGKAYLKTHHDKQGTPHDTPYVAPHVTPQVVNLLETINGEMTRKEIMDALNLKDTKNFQKTYLNKALEAELIEMTIPQKPKSRRQTYRVTEAGKAYLKTHHDKQGTPHDTPYVAPYVAPHVTPQVVNLLEIINGEMTRKEIMDALNLKDTKNFQKTYLNKALEAELIEMAIPQKPKSRRQTYRVTEAGKAYLKTHHDKQGTPHDTPYVAPHVTPQVVNLLETINGEMTRKEIMDALNLKDTKNFQKTYLNKALEAELIEMTIPQKPKSRRQTYRVTETGKAYLKTHHDKQGTPHDTPYVAPQVTPQVTPQVVNLLETINGEMTRKEIMDALNLKDTKNFQKTYLNKALEAELIEMTIPQKPKSRRQTYRVTETGKAYLKTHHDKQGTPHDTPYVAPQVTPQVVNLLETINGEMTRKEIMDALNLKDTKNFQKTYLNKALEAELIEMTIPDKPKSKLQKYRVTQKGVLFLKTRTNPV